MKCPHCSSTDTRVIASRPSDEGHAIRRRRECDQCDRRFTTYERIQLEALMVRKRSGRLEAFQPDKLLGKLSVATNKRPVSDKQLREFVYGFEDEVQSARIDADDIGRRALAFLKALDDVAYIRFLSVYKDFDNVERFIEEIRQLGDTQERVGVGVGASASERTNDTPADGAVDRTGHRAGDRAGDGADGGESEDRPGGNTAARRTRPPD